MFSTEIIVLALGVLIVGGALSGGALIAAYKCRGGDSGIAFGIGALIAFIGTLICFYNVLMEAGKLIR
jgi:hypothetical protein